MIKSEDEFLHDLSGPIAAAVFVADMMAEHGDLGQLDQLKKALAQVEVLLRARRDALSKEESDTA